MPSRSWLTTEQTLGRRVSGSREISDAELLDAMRRDDGCALEVVLRRHWAPLTAYLARLLDSRDLAEDVAQRSYCQLWARRATWRREGSLRALLFRIARNFAISERRRRIVEHRTVATAGSPMAHNPTPADVLDDRQLRVALESAIRRLPERRREVFVLRCVHGLSYREVAEVMVISTQTVANQLSLALATLRRDLAGLLDE